MMETTRMNEDLEDKAREVMRVMGEQLKYDYRRVLICATDDQDHTTVICVHKDPSIRGGHPRHLVFIINAINAWFMTLCQMINPPEESSSDFP